jgi:hypothetical protein
LLATFAVVASLNHLRFLLFAAIILVPILAPRLRLFAPYDANKDKPWLNLAITAAIVAIIVGSYPSAAELQNRIDGQFPRDALRFMQQRQITGRLFNWYDFGGYIEFYAPTIKTFADGRTDIFVYSRVLDDYLKINSIEEPLELLDKYKIDYVLFPVNKHLTYVLDHSSAWRTIYEDKVVKLYQRVPVAAAVFQKECVRALSACAGCCALFDMIAGAFDINYVDALANQGSHKTNVGRLGLQKYLSLGGADGTEEPIELEEASGALQSGFRNRYLTCTLSYGLEQKQ